jgi:hypothetical protein
MSGINASQFRSLVVAPIVMAMTPDTPQAIDLLMGTAMQESGLIALHQYGAGPALGLFEIEPVTAQGLYADVQRSQFWTYVQGLIAPGLDPVNQLIGNLYYECAMARFYYWRCPGAIPTTPEDQAQYYKLYYNTPAGAATVEEYLANWATLQKLLGG